VHKPAQSKVGGLYDRRNIVHEKWAKQRENTKVHEGACVLGASVLGNSLDKLAARFLEAIEDRHCLAGVSVGCNPLTFFRACHMVE
jgi:hypothetical protein